jgi:hypothetical protein
MPSVNLAFKQDDDFLEIRADDRYIQDNTVVYEFHDCKKTNIEYILENDQIEALVNRKVPYDLFEGYEDDPQTCFVRWNGNEKMTKIIKNSDLHIPLITLKEAMENDSLEELIKSQLAQVFVVPLQDL